MGKRWRVVHGRIDAGLAEAFLRQARSACVQSKSDEWNASRKRILQEKTEKYPREKPSRGVPEVRMIFHMTHERFERTNIVAFEVQWE